MPFTIYADLECLLEKIDKCENDPNKTHTTKINKHTIGLFNIYTLFIR